MSSFSLIKSLKKKFAKIYKHVAPLVKPNTTKNVPIHFPKINPPIKNIGAPKPKRKTQIIVNRKNINEAINTFVSYAEIKYSLLIFINS